MSWFRSAVLYTALVLGANAAQADRAALEALREGDMKKLSFHKAPREVPEATLVDIDGAPASLVDYHGKYVVLNFWATWCGPCRKEMPHLDSLQAQMGGEDFAVVPVASGLNPVPGIRNFFAKEGISNLQTLRDPQQALSREMGILALPVTVILDPEGREIARMIGDADWASDSALAILQTLLAGTG